MAQACSIGWRTTEIQYYSDVFDELIQKVAAQPLKVQDFTHRLAKTVGRIEAECAKLPLRGASSDLAAALLRIAEARARYDVVAASPDPSSARRLTMKSIATTSENGRVLIAQCESLAAEYAANVAQIAAAHDSKRPVDGIDSTGVGEVDPPLTIADPLLRQAALSSEIRSKIDAAGRLSAAAIAAATTDAAALGTSVDAYIFFVATFVEALRQVMGMAPSIPTAAGTAPAPPSLPAAIRTPVPDEPAAAERALSNATRGVKAASAQQNGSDVHAAAAVVKPVAATGVPATVSDVATRTVAAPPPAAPTASGMVISSSLSLSADEPLRRLEYPGYDQTHEEIEAVLTRFYMFHNPSKITDVKAIVKGYLNRGTSQEKLFAELNKKYKTDEPLTSDDAHPSASADALHTTGASGDTGARSSSDASGGAPQKESSRKNGAKTTAGNDGDDAGGCVVQ